MPEGERAAAWGMALHSAAITARSCMQGFIREATFYKSKLFVLSVYRRGSRAERSLTQIRVMTGLRIKSGNPGVTGLKAPVRRQQPPEGGGGSGWR